MFCLCPLVLRLTQYLRGRIRPPTRHLDSNVSGVVFGHLEHELRSGIECLNEIAGFAPVGPQRPLFNSQVHAVRRLAPIYSDVGVCPVEHLQPERAFQSLIGVKTGYSPDDGAASLVLLHCIVKEP